MADGQERIGTSGDRGRPVEAKLNDRHGKEPAELSGRGGTTSAVLPVPPSLPVLAAVNPAGGDCGDSSASMNFLFMGHPCCGKNTSDGGHV